MESHDNPINKIKTLDLSTYPYDKVRDNITQMGKIGLLQIIYHPGKIVRRARPNDVNHQFKTREELSYKRQNYYTTYQRASTPNSTMLYGVSFPDELPPDYEINSRLVSAAETSYLLRQEGQDGEANSNI